MEGETLKSNQYTLNPGGKGANQAYTIGKLGGNVSFIGAVGNDAPGEILKNSLSSVNVDISSVETFSGVNTGTAFINIDSNGKNNILIIEGANGKVDKAIIDKNISKIKEADIILMQLEIPIKTVQYVCEIANDKIIILDPAPAVSGFPNSIISSVDIMKPNETELEILTGMPTSSFDEVLKAGQIILEKGVKNLIVSLGEKGSMLLTKEGHTVFPAIPVNAIDTTAAGDSFIASVALYLSQDHTLKESIEFGSKVASLSVQKKGAQPSIPSLEDVNRYYSSK